jgi:hypothetical protein
LSYIVEYSLETLRATDDVSNGREVLRGSDSGVSKYAIVSNGSDSPRFCSTRVVKVDQRMRWKGSVSVGQYSLVVERKLPLYTADSSEVLTSSEGLCSKRKPNSSAEKFLVGVFGDVLRGCKCRSCYFDRRPGRPLLE